VVTEMATDCDDCHRPISYGEMCWAMDTGHVWDGNDQDHGKPVIEVVCTGCREARIARGKQ
jgi:hypothetical protein